MCTQLSPAVISRLTVECLSCDRTYDTQKVGLVRRPEGTSVGNPRRDYCSHWSLYHRPNIRPYVSVRHLCLYQVVDEFCSLEALVMLKSKSVMAMSITAIMYAVRELFYNQRDVTSLMKILVVPLLAALTFGTQAVRDYVLT